MSIGYPNVLPKMIHPVTVFKVYKNKAALSNNFELKCFNLYLIRFLYSTGVLLYLPSSYSPNLDT